MSDYQQDQNSNAPAETVLREFSMALSAPPVNGAQKPPRFSMGIYRNKPTLQVRTNDPNDNGKDNGMIRAEPGIPDFYAIKNALRSLIADKTPRKIPVDLKARRFGAGGQLSQEKMLNARVLVGRDERGVLFISLLHWNKDRPAIKFPFGPQVTSREEVIWGDGQGGTLAADVVSEFYAAAWCDIIDKLISHLLVIGYRPAPPRNQGGGGGGNYRGNNNGGGGYRNNNGNGGGGNNYQRRDDNNSGGNRSSGNDSFGGFEEDDLPI